MLKQRTIQHPTRTVGIGLHSGYKVELVLRPAAPDTGIVFHRTDLNPEVSIPVSAQAIGETMLASTLVKDGVRISTIEHLMSACAGLGIDNLHVEVNAEEYGYTLIPRSDFSSAEHYVGGVKSTREALKWVFEAKPGEVSPLYECGENDHLMVVALERVNKAGYRNINHVADALRAEIRRDKKAEKIMAQMKNCTSIDQVKALENAVSDTVKHVTFSAPAYIAVTGRSELAVSAVAEKTAIDKTSAPIKGNGGVYMIQVYKKDKGSEEFDAKKEETTLANMAANIVSRQFMNDLYQRGKVEDKRYLYF